MCSTQRVQRGDGKQIVAERGGGIKEDERRFFFCPENSNSAVLRLRNVSVFSIQFPWRATTARGVVCCIQKEAEKSTCCRTSCVSASCGGSLARAGLSAQRDEVRNERSLLSLV